MWFRTTVPLAIGAATTSPRTRRTLGSITVAFPPRKRRSFTQRKATFRSRKDCPCLQIICRPILPMVVKSLPLLEFPVETATPVGRLVEMPIEEEMKGSYLTYAMSVIVSLRAA